MKFENIYKGTEENMRLALLSLWAPGQHPMRPAIEELLEREPLLAEPVFQSTFGWETTDNDDWRNDLNPDVIRMLRIGENYAPYRHQAESWNALKEGRSVVVTSGTGSGKTECFMYPVISDLYEQGNQNAIEAIFLYPLNALMEDQKKRLNNYCQATGLHFAVYNGDTPERREDGRHEPMSNEVGTRCEIRDERNEGTRPQILLTNPSMLEYILVRQKDQIMLQESAGRLRWIVIDEAHSYSGSSAVELAYQIKRILDAFSVRPQDVRFACTSATIGAENGMQSLAEFISSITGQPIQQIQVIGGNRLVKPLDENLLREELTANNLPPTDVVLSLREKINQVAGMTLQQIWEWLRPDVPYGMDKLLPALQMIDELCEITQEGNPVLSLRGHFFMRTISGIYACANSNCSGANPAIPQYGHLTTYKASVCPDCGAPLMELVQCKRCGGFVLMGCSDTQSHKIYPREDAVNQDNFFAIETPSELEEDDERMSEGHPETFFLQPYEREKFFNPVSKAQPVILRIVQEENDFILENCPNGDGDWVEVRKEDGHSYCPSCGRLAQGKRLNLKHFRIPINFINQTISPILLRECAQGESSWGKYIAFTDSRQGTAISAKTFNINVERIRSREKLLQRLVNVANYGYTQQLINIPGLTEEQIRQILAVQQNNNPEGLSLEQVSDCMYDEYIFRHIAGRNRENERGAYKAALIRQIIGRKPIYEGNAENMGLISLVYPGLNDLNRPNSLNDYMDRYGGNLTDRDWQDFLKIALDYFFRAGNHIQPLVELERKYVRDTSISTPVSAPDDIRTGISRWPLVNINNNNDVSPRQSRLILLLCAGLGINNLEELNDRRNAVNSIMNDAWSSLVDNHIIKRVSADDRDGYNHTRHQRNNDYVGCYYLDLSGTASNNVCRIVLAGNMKICPVTNKLLDTTFCGYSPQMEGEVNRRLFEKFKCSDLTMAMPVRPQNNEEVNQWLDLDERIQQLKTNGFWNNRHKYAYKDEPTYIAAEHSAQQSKELLRIYTSLFSQPNAEINVLHCSTTMEMGVDIGDIDIVLMDTIPPTAANYLQRVGRAGRTRQTKAVAFSLCNNTPVGQNAFANPMWALQTVNHMIKVRPSQTIIQRHINSFFLRQFICGNGIGIQANASIDDFMTTICDGFIDFLNDMNTNKHEEGRFHQVFGDNIPFTINITIEIINNIRNEYNNVIQELNDAFNAFNGDDRRRLAISNQLRKTKSESMLKYLSEHQFIPNANMPTGVVVFDFIDRDQADSLRTLYQRIDKLKNQIETETDDAIKLILQEQLTRTREEISDLQRATSASRDIYTALNEYAPEQTVVVNEKNYVSAGVSLFGAYNQETQTRGIYHCIHCGHTEYKNVIQEGLVCPVCRSNYRGIIDSRNSTYTWAYEPIGFKTDQTLNGSREENTDKRFYEIRPVLLNTDWTNPVHVNMCEILGSGDNGNILFYNVANGYGFAFCKRCGRAAVEFTTSLNNDSMPVAVRPGHNRLWGDVCDANNGDIARHVVFTGYHPTCYAVLRFKKDIASNEFENDEQLAYSLGVVLKRALALSEGIDENEIDFGVKQEPNAWVLFIYDTAKGGCGYSLKLTNPVLCQEVFDLARKSLEETTCKCHIDGGACAKCLVDRNNYRHEHLLSKKKALDWLNRQKNREIQIPNSVREASPYATITYQTLKNILKKSINEADVRRITLCVSDNSDDCAVTDWTSIRSEMGKYLKNAVLNDKTVTLVIEYHPEHHHSLVDKLPYINLKDKFPDCEVKFVRDMGELKTAIIVETDFSAKRYFTDDDSSLSFSNNWGNNCNYFFVDDNAIGFQDEEEPTYTVQPSEIIREGITHATTFQINKYFQTAIAPYVLRRDDIDWLVEILRGKHVDITFSDMYMNSALASLMLVYLIDELRQLFGFTIDNITLQIDSPKRKCTNVNYNEWTPIGMNFESKEDADNYTDTLIQNVLGIDAEHSFNDANHHRWLRFETTDRDTVEIRPDHGISGGYKSTSRYMNLGSLSGSVVVYKNNEDVLYYVIIKKANE